MSIPPPGTVIQDAWPVPYWSCGDVPNRTAQYGYTYDARVILAVDLSVFLYLGKRRMLRLSPVGHIASQKI
jgi:hypothetical protein